MRGPPKSGTAANPLTLPASSAWDPEDPKGARKDPFLHPKGAGSGFDSLLGGHREVKEAGVSQVVILTREPFIRWAQMGDRATAGYTDKCRGCEPSVQGGQSRRLLF